VNTAEAAPPIALDQVTKTYGSGRSAFQALRGVDLRIAVGEFVAIMGPSGSGKTTLMNIIGCLDTVSSGSYRFLGTAVETLDRSQRARLRRHYLGFVFQGFNLLARTTALENVELPMIYAGVGGREREERARAALERVGLGARLDHHPTSGDEGGGAMHLRRLEQPARVVPEEEPERVGALVAVGTGRSEIERPRRETVAKTQGSQQRGLDGDGEGHPVIPTDVLDGAGGSVHRS